MPDHQTTNEQPKSRKKSTFGATESQSSRQQIKQMAELDVLSRDLLDEMKLIYPGTSNRHALDVFRDLRTKLLQRSAGRNFICMVSSVCQGGGASHVAMNLSAAFALDPAKTSLLIDCNLYDPHVDKLIGGETEFGITDYLEDPSLDVHQIVLASGIPRLRVITVGSNCEGGAEYFSSRRMEEFFETVRERYPDRFIIVDAPMISSSEARILSDLCDLVLLVVPYGKVTAAQVRAGVDSVQEDKLVGLVFNH